MKVKGQEGGAAAGGAEDRPWRTAWLLALGGVLLCAAFWPPLGGLSVYFALVPAFLAARRAPIGRLFVMGWVAGYFANLFLFYWIMIVTVPGGLLLPIYLGLYLPVFLTAVELLNRRLAVPRVVGAIFLWPLLEMVRGWLFTGLPWFYLGHALYRWPVLIQAADTGGVMFLSALIILVNALLADALASRAGPKRRTAFIAAAAAVLILQAGYGRWRLSRLAVRAGPTVALVQPNVPQSLKIEQTPEDSARIFARLRRLTMSEAARAGEIVFWPETIMPGFVEAPDYTAGNGMKAAAVVDEYRLRGLVNAGQAARILEAADAGADVMSLLEAASGAGGEDVLRTSSLLAATAEIAGKPLVAGAIAAELNDAGEVARNYNRACHFDERGRLVDSYDKVHLVPFGEYVPFRRSFPPAARLLALIMPLEPLTYPGPRFKTFEIAGLKWGVSICFEDTFSYIGRRYRALGADVLVNLTNDGWFGRSFELEAHLGSACLRAVETRMAVVRAANTGISAVIAPTGAVVARLADEEGRDRAVTGVLVCEVPVSPARTAYMRVGEWWMAGAALLAVLFMVRGSMRHV